MSDVTRILSAIEQGDLQASEDLLPLVYDELRRLAARKMAQENPAQTLQATALVHEAYVRLVEVEKVQQWHSRGHFFAAAAEAMRRILVEQARRKGRLKHGGERVRVDFDGVEISGGGPTDEILAIHEALDGLAAEEPIAAEIVKRRFFAGVSIEEIADDLGIARSTAYEHWSYARAWLHDALYGHHDGRAV
jgi:RNA polymerase sigma factor (TIGR02999 family)